MIKQVLADPTLSRGTIENTISDLWYALSFYTRICLNSNSKLVIVTVTDLRVFLFFFYIKI